MVRPRGQAYSSSRRKGAATHPLAAVAMMRVITIDVLRGEHGGEADRHPDGRRRRAGLELRHQVGGVPERGARLHCGGAPARLGSPDPRRPSGSGEPHPLRAASHAREHAYHRSHRRHLSPHLAHQPLAHDQAAPRAEWPGVPAGDGTYDVTRAVQKNIETLGLDHLIAIGGDDTLSYAAELSRRGTPVMAVPKTMDNDVRDTEYCIGFSTAVTRAIDAIERQRTTVGSHERIGIFRVFGRDAGHTALYTAYVTSMRCCIPEYHVSLPKLIELLLADKRNNPSNYSIVVLSEGAQWEGYTVKEYGEPDAFGHRRKMSVAEDLSAEIKAATGEDTVVSDLTYDLRSGTPDFVDRMVAITFAGMAMDAIQEGKQGLMTAVSHGRYDLVPIPDPQFGPRKLEVATTYDTERYRPIYANKRGLPIFLNRAS